MTNTHTLVQEVNSTNVDSILQTATSLLTGPSTTTIDVNLKDENGHTALHVLIMGIKKENEDQIVTVMTFLLKHMADPNIQDNRGMTVLHLLTNGLDELLDGGIDILPTLVTLFLNHDAKPSVQNKIKMTPLHLLVARLTKKNKGNRLGGEELHPEETIRLVQVLLQHGGHPSATTIQGTTALHAMMYGLKRKNQQLIFEVITLLLEKGANPKIQTNKDGETVLDILIKKLNNDDDNDELDREGVVDLVRVFIKYGADPNVASTDNGRTPLLNLIDGLTKKNQQVSFDVATLLLEDHPNQEDTDGTKEDDGAKNKEDDGAKNTNNNKKNKKKKKNNNNKKVHRDKDGFTVLHLLADRLHKGLDQEGVLALIRLFLTKGLVVLDAKETLDGTTALHRIVNNLFDINEKLIVAVLTLLLKHDDHQHHYPGITAATVASGLNQQDDTGSTVLLILASRLDDDQLDQDETHLVLFKLFVQYGALPTISNEYRHTPLHISGVKVYRQNQRLCLEVAEVLLKEGHANPNATDMRGDTVLHILTNMMLKKTEEYELLDVMEEAYELVELLVQTYGANVKAKNHGGQTPLHLIGYRIVHENSGLALEMAQLYLDHGVDPNVQDQTGDTTLHWLTKKNPNRNYGPQDSIFDFINLLLKHDADPSIRNYFGRPALDMLY